MIHQELTIIGNDMTPTFYKFTVNNYKKVFINKAMENANCIVDDYDEELITGRSMTSNGFNGRRSNNGKMSP